MSLLNEAIDADLAALEIELEQLRPTPRTDDQRQKPKRATLSPGLPRADIHHEPRDRRQGHARQGVLGAGQCGQRVMRGDWNAALIAELRGFPFGTHDDQVDALSRAFALLIARRRMRISHAALATV